MFQDCVVGTREIQELEQICLTRQQRNVTGVGTTTTTTTPSFSLSLFSCDIESMSDLIHLIQEKFPTLVERLEFGGSFNVSYAQLSLLISATSLSCRTLNLMLNLQQQQQQRAQQQEHLLDEPRVVVPSTAATLSTTTVASPQLQQQVQVPCNPFQSFWNHATLHTLRVSELDGSSTTTTTTPSLLAYLAETLPQLPQLRIVTLSIWNLTTTSFCTLVQKGLLPAQQLQVVELSEVRFGSINQSALPIFLQLLFDTNLIHLGICGLYSLFQNNNDDNDNNSSNNNNENSNDDNDNNRDNRWIPNSFRRNPPYYHNSNNNNNNSCSLSKQIQQILNNRKLKGQCIKNSTLQIFTMRNISIMSQDVTKELLILFLTRFSVLTSLSWTDHAVSLLSSSSSSSVPSLPQPPVPSQLSSSSSLSSSLSLSFAVPLHTNLSLTYFGCQKWNSSHYSHQSRIVLPKPIQLWLYLWTKRNHNWSRVNKFLNKKNTQVSSCCRSCCCHVDDDDDKKDNDIHNTTTTTQQQLNRKNQISSSSSSSSSCWALYPLIIAQSHPNSIQHALLPSLIHSRFMESNNVVVVV